MCKPVELCHVGHPHTLHAETEMCVAFACEEERIVMNDVVQVDVDINASRQPILFTFAEVLENKIFSIFCDFGTIWYCGI